MNIVKGLFAKSKSGYKKVFLIATKLTSICCVYKEKIVKNGSYWRTQRPYKFRKLQHSTRIVKNQFNSKQIIQILQTVVIDYFSTYSYLVNISWYFWFCFFKIIFASAGFSNIPGKYENVVSLSKILETGINVFNFYECVEK